MLAVQDPRMSQQRMSLLLMAFCNDVADDGEEYYIHTYTHKNDVLVARVHAKDHGTQTL